MPSLQRSPGSEAVSEEMVGLVGSSTGIVGTPDGGQHAITETPAGALGTDRRESGADAVESQEGGDWIPDGTNDGN
jgi:hypothetical protein